MSDALEEFRRRNAGKVITWVFPGEVVEDADGTPAGMTPNITGTEVDGVAVAGWESDQ